METNFLDTCTFAVKAPKDCSETEIENFHQAVLKGSKVSPNNLINRIKNCELLAFCNREGQLIGVSSIKQPSENYVRYVIENANLERNWGDLKFEIGYSFTEESFRKNGISKELKSRLLKSMKPDSGILFSTTAITSSRNYFLANGFNQIGQAYDGENDKGIMYYEIIL